MEYRNLTPNLRRALAIGGIALLAVVATIGLTHKGEPATAAALTSPALSGNPEPVSRDSTDQLPNSPVVSAVSPFGATAPPPPVYSTPTPVTAELAPTQAPIIETAARRRRVVTRRYYYTRYRGRRVRRTRPFSHSAAIVAGSAAGGAVVGGLVGGGKGAGIGALAGAGGGLIYDRATRKRRHR